MCTWSSSPSSSPRETCPQSLRHGQVSVQLCLLSKKRSQICVMSQARGLAPDLFYRAWPQTCYFRLNLMPLWLSEIETLPHEWKLLGEEREQRVSSRLAMKQSDHCHHLWHFSSQEKECREIMNSYEILAKDQQIMCTNPMWIQAEIFFVIILPDILCWQAKLQLTFNILAWFCSASMLQTEKGCGDSCRRRC